MDSASKLLFLTVLTVFTLGSCKDGEEENEIVWEGSESTWEEEEKGISGREMGSVMIIQGPPSHMFYIPAVKLVLLCVTEGSPMPSISWTLNDQLIDKESMISNGIHMQTTNHSSSIHLNTKYFHSKSFHIQCHAHNNHGKVFSNRTLLTPAVLHEKDSNRWVQNISVIEGRPLLLHCTNILSTPPPTHLWSLLEFSTNTPTTTFNWETSVVDDKAGKLIFPSVVKENMEDMVIKYDAYNFILRKKITGCLFRLIIVSDHYTYDKAPELIYATSNVRVMEGDDVVLLCIFSGSASIEWQRILPPSNKSTFHLSDKLAMKGVSLADDGLYKCVASNEQGHATTIVSLVVETKPSIVAPLEQSYVEIGGTAIFKCNCTGKPEVNYSWMVNSHPLNSTTEESKSFREFENILVVENVQTWMRGVVVCNASNHNGYILQYAKLSIKGFSTRLSAKRLTSLPYKTPFSSHFFSPLSLLLFIFLVICIVSMATLCYKSTKHRPYQVKFTNFMLKNNFPRNPNQPPLHSPPHPPNNTPILSTHLQANNYPSINLPPIHLRTN